MRISDMTPEQDAAHTRLRLALLYEQLQGVQDKIRWEKEAYTLRNPDYVVE